MKYRRLRFSNPKIQGAIVDSQGGIELLLACGFLIVFEKVEEGEGKQEEEEGFAVLEDEELDVDRLHAVSYALKQVVTVQAHGKEPSGATLSSSSSSTVPPPQPPPPQQQQEQQLPIVHRKERIFAPPRASRNTQVILPQSLNTEVPAWFFETTGAELKAAFLNAVKKRESSQMLMTKDMRARISTKQASNTNKTAATYATVKVRLPEGIFLQGAFDPGEPVAAIFAWVAQHLVDPLQTFDLILPDRRVLGYDSRSAEKEEEERKLMKKINSAAAGSSTTTTTTSRQRGPSSIVEAGLMPSVTLHLRWTEHSAVEMKDVPALRQDVMVQSIV